MRLITRGDLDGLACAAIIGEKEPVDRLLLVHPQEIFEKKYEISAGDILANVPYDPRCGKWFDHRLLTTGDEAPPEDFDGRFSTAPSAAQLVWEYYGEDPRFEEMVREVNRFDSAQLTREDVVDPKGYVLFGYTMDARTGLGAFETYFRKCIDWVRSLPIDQVLEQPEVRQRIQTLKRENETFRKALLDNTHLDGNVILTDFRSYLPPPIGNRFLVYILFPKGNVSLRVHWGPHRRTLVAVVAHSIFNRTCKTSVGDLLARYGGGGHRGAGSAPLALEDSDEKLQEILDVLKTNG